MSFLTKIRTLLTNKTLKLTGSLFETKEKCFYLSSLKRSYMKSIPRSMFKEGNYLKKDKIPPGYSIIYRAPLEYYMFWAKEITTLTSIIVGAIVLHKFVKDKWLPHTRVIPIGELYTTEEDLHYFFWGFVLITVAVRLMVGRVPLRIYKNQAKYIAVFQGQLPLVRTKKYFERGEVVEVASNRLNPWGDMTYRMKDSRVVLFIDYFKTPSEMFEMFSKDKE